MDTDLKVIALEMIEAVCSGRGGLSEKERLTVGMWAHVALGQCEDPHDAEEEAMRKTYAIYTLAVSNIFSEKQ